MTRKKQSNAFFISFNKACKLCGFSRKAFAQELRAGTIETFRRGRAVFVAKSDIERLILSRAMESKRQELLSALASA